MEVRVEGAAAVVVVRLVVERDDDGNAIAGGTSPVVGLRSRSRR
jgi:hypothetical protein